MSRLVSKLLGSVSSGSTASSPPTHHLILRESPQDSAVTLVHPVNLSSVAPPIYSIHATQSKNVFYRGEVHPQNTIGETVSTKMGLAVQLSLRGQTGSVRGSNSDIKYVVESPAHGRFDWKPNPMTGTGLYLYDKSGVKIAAYKNNGLMNLSERQLVVFVPCDGYFVEFILMTAHAAKELDKTAEEIVMEVMAA